MLHITCKYQWHTKIPRNLKQRSLIETAHPLQVQELWCLYFSGPCDRLTLLFVSIRWHSEQVHFYVKLCKGLIKPMLYWLLGLCCACSSVNQAGKILWIVLNSTEKTLTVSTMIPTSLKHGEGLRICSSMAHLTEACRMLPSYSRELCVPLGVPRERSYPGSLK